MSAKVRQLLKLEAVVKSWRLAPGPESILQSQVAAALAEYALILDNGLPTQDHIDALRERGYVVMCQPEDGDAYEVTWVDTRRTEEEG